MSPANDRTGFGLLGMPAVPAMIEIAKRAEELGYESIWVAETRLTRDGVIPLAAMAPATRQIKLATGIVNAYTRGPVLTAVTFATLDELCHGRAIMGLGAGSPLVLAPQGVAFDRPLTRLREFAHVVQRLIAGQTVSFQGMTLSVANARLELTPVRSHIPLYLGVTGPRALALCGEIADGAMLNAFLPTSYVVKAVQRIEAGAQKAGKTPGQVDMAGALVVSVDEDSRAAKDRVRPLIALYLSLFPNIARETELDDSFIVEIRRVFHAEGIQAAARKISDLVVDALTVAGTPAECRERIAAYREAGLQLPILFPVEDSLQHALELLDPWDRKVVP